jgi:hypothetical protein
VAALDLDLDLDCVDRDDRRPPSLRPIAEEQYNGNSRHRPHQVIHKPHPASHTNPSRHSYPSSVTDWKAKYYEAAEMLTETKNELDDFHQSSKELEEELERELQRTEKAQQELRVKVERAEGERDSWKVRRIHYDSLSIAPTFHI